MNAIKVTTKTGKSIYVEVADPVPAPKAARGGQIAGGGKIEEAVTQLAEVGDVIADVCRTLQERIEAALEKTKPNELALQFSITLAGETAIPLITKASAQGTFQVSAKWVFAKEAANV
jgi:Trypsin-co-occurring domain 1